MTPWRVVPLSPKPPSLLARVLAWRPWRKEPTAYQRCLSVHLFFADPRNGGALR